MYKYLIGERGPRLRGTRVYKVNKKKSTKKTQDSWQGNCHVSAGKIMDHHQEACVASCG